MYPEDKEQRYPDQPVRERTLATMVDENAKMIQEASEILFGITERIEKAVGSIPNKAAGHPEEKIATPQNMRDATEKNLMSMGALIRKLNYVAERVTEII